MTEEQVTKAVMEWLDRNGWEILDYDFPGGGTGRRFRFADAASRQDKNTGAFCPDVVAWRDGLFLLFENKAVDTLSDYGKQAKVKQDPTLPEQLKTAYPEKSFRGIWVALAFAVPFLHGDTADKIGIDAVLTVSSDNSVSLAFASAAFSGGTT